MEALKKEIAYLKAQIRDIQLADRQTRQETEQQQIDRVELKRSIRAGETIPTAEEAHQRTFHDCRSCRHAEVTRYYKATWDEEMRHGQKHRTRSMTHHLELICGRQHGRPLEFLVSGCSMWDEEPGERLLAQQSEQSNDADNG